MVNPMLPIPHPQAPTSTITGGTANPTFTTGVSGENAVISAIDIVPSNGCTKPPPPQPIQHVFVVVLENANPGRAGSAFYGVACLSGRVSQQLSRNSSPVS